MDSSITSSFEKRIKYSDNLEEIKQTSYKEEILKGLTTVPKYISPKFFYDDKGSVLFEKITKLDEYYPSRTEKQLLLNITDETDINFNNLNIVELGSGDNSKIQLLLQQLPGKTLKSINYFPVDISRSALKRSSEELFKMFPALSINATIADFMNNLNFLPKKGGNLICFFGSTIGNLNKSERDQFLKLLSSKMKLGDSFLLGIDMVKDIGVLEDAYNDKTNVTAEFNKNILNSVNRITNSDFKTKDFEHQAFYNINLNRIEMHLKAKKNLIVNFDSGRQKIKIAKDEMVHTENSHKFTKERIQAFSKTLGMNVKNIITDDNKYFSLVYFVKI